MPSANIEIFISMNATHTFMLTHHAVAYLFIGMFAYSLLSRMAEHFTDLNKSIPGPGRTGPDARLGRARSISCSALTHGSYNVSYNVNF